MAGLIEVQIYEIVLNLLRHCFRLYTAAFLRFWNVYLIVYIDWTFLLFD